MGGLPGRGVIDQIFSEPLVSRLADVHPIAVHIASGGIALLFVLIGHLAVNPVRHLLRTRHPRRLHPNTQPSPQRRHHRPARRQARLVRSALQLGAAEDGLADLVADVSDMVEVLSGRTVRNPVLVAFPMEIGARVAAAHCDQHVEGFPRP